MSYFSGYEMRFIMSDGLNRFDRNFNFANSVLCKMYMVREKCKRC